MRPRHDSFLPKRGTDEKLPKSCPLSSSVYRSRRVPLGRGQASAVYGDLEFGLGSLQDLVDFFLGFR